MNYISSKKYLRLYLLIVHILFLLTISLNNWWVLLKVIWALITNHMTINSYILYPLLKFKKKAMKHPRGVRLWIYIHPIAFTHKIYRVGILTWQILNGWNTFNNLWSIGHWQVLISKWKFLISFKTLESKIFQNH